MVSIVRIFEYYYWWNLFILRRKIQYFLNWIRKVFSIQTLHRARSPISLRLCNFIFVTSYRGTVPLLWRLVKIMQFLENNLKKIQWNCNWRQLWQFLKRFIKNVTKLWVFSRAIYLICRINLTPVFPMKYSVSLICNVSNIFPNAIPFQTIFDQYHILTMQHAAVG